MTPQTLNEFLDAIYSATNEFRRTGKEPKAIYLGSETRHRFYSDPLVRSYLTAASPAVQRDEICGIPVFRVNDK